MNLKRQHRIEKYRSRYYKKVSEIYEMGEKINTPDHVNEGDNLQVAQTLFNINSVIESYDRIKKYLNNKRRNKERVYKVYCEYYNSIKEESELLKIKGYRSPGLERILLLDVNVSTDDIVKVEKIN